MFDAIENDPIEIVWRGGKTVRCTYLCQVCGCTWTDRWPTWGLFGIEFDTEI
ncbi:hypothetical protein ACQP06_03005 [Nocardia sp. CA-136227]|uniref:hypothetical protein n=1 Tax=Nocardia sp. CA-136227 TaxID=3239979 RepID=UPI003D99B93E